MNESHKQKIELSILAQYQMSDLIEARLPSLHDAWSPEQTEIAQKVLKHFDSWKQKIDDCHNIIDELTGNKTDEVVIEIGEAIERFRHQWIAFEELAEKQIARWLLDGDRADLDDATKRRAIYSAAMWQERLIHERVWRQQRQI